MPLCRPHDLLLLFSADFALSTLSANAYLLLVTFPLPPSQFPHSSPPSSSYSILPPSIALSLMSIFFLLLRNHLYLYPYPSPSPFLSTFSITNNISPSISLLSRFFIPLTHSFYHPLTLFFPILLCCPSYTSLYSHLYITFTITPLQSFPLLPRLSSFSSFSSYFLSRHHIT